MRRPELPLYGPSFPAPERVVLSILHAALAAAQAALRDEHPLLEDALRSAQSNTPLVAAVAQLIVHRADELRSLLDFYDAAVDEHLQDLDGDIPF